MKLFLSKLLPLFTAGVILLCSVFALVPIESFADDFSISFDTDSAFSGQSRHLTIIDVTDNVTLYDVTFSSQTYSISIPLSDHVYSISVYRIKPDGNHVYAYYIRFNYGNLTNTLLSRDSSSPSVISNLDITRFYVYSWSSDSNYTPYSCYFQFDSSVVPTPTSTPEPTPTPTPAPTPAPGIDDFFRPFRSFSGAYYNSSAIYPPDSLTLNKYEQYTGLVSNKPIRVTDVRTNIDFLDDKVVYKFEYDFRAGATDSFDISILYDADNIFGYDYAYITVGGETFDGYALSQSPLTGTYRVFGNADVPEALQGYTNWSWEHDLVNQKAISISGINLSVDDRVTLTVIVASSTLPHIPSSFDWSQFFQDTRPDNVFLATTGGLAALPFFISGLSFLALGALIGIILKFMR